MSNRDVLTLTYALINRVVGAICFGMWQGSVTAGVFMYCAIWALEVLP